MAGISNAEAAEGDPLNFIVTLSNASTTPTDVTLTSIGGNSEPGKATIGTDTGPMQYSVDGGQTYSDVPASGVVSVPPGATSFLVRIPTVDDKVYEGTETLTLQAATVVNTAPVSGTGTITDIADLPKISINDPAEVNEGDGTNTVTFTVTLSNSSNLPVTVAYATANGTALAGSD